MEMPSSQQAGGASTNLVRREIRGQMGEAEKSRARGDFLINFSAVVSLEH